MLARRSLLRGVAGLAAIAIAPAAVAATPRPRLVEICSRIEPPTTLGGARLVLPVPPEAAIVLVRGDADRVERTAGALEALWKPGAVSPWIEAVVRTPKWASITAPSVTTAVGVLPAGWFGHEVERREVLA